MVLCIKNGGLYDGLRFVTKHLQESCAGCVFALLLGQGGGLHRLESRKANPSSKQRQAIVTLSACGGSVASDLSRRIERRKYFDNAVTNILGGKKTH